MRLIALVPVRAGSKGLPGKNLRPLAGVPLWRRAVDQGRAVGAEVVVSTDIPELLALPREPGVQILERPAALAGDAVPMDPVIAHALDTRPGPATVLLLQATSPLRRIEDIRAGLALHATGAWDLVMSVAPADAGVLKWGRLDDGAFRALGDPAHPFANRQSLPPVWRPDGAVYVFDADAFRSRGTLACRRIGAVPVPADCALDIDGAADFARAETALRGRDGG
ncbi:MAG: acylneuraminate cytidylyltransferase family protein [Alkalilacustris sp.]